MLRASDLFSGVDESWPNNPRQILKKPLKSLINPQNIGTFILHCLYTSDRIKIEKKTEKKRNRAFLIKEIYRPHFGDYVFMTHTQIFQVNFT